MLDVIMLSLRLAAGLDLRQFEGEFGAEAAELVWGSLQPHVQRGLVYTLPQGAEWVRGGSGAAGPISVRLSDPRGFMLSNDIISDVFAAFQLD